MDGIQEIAESVEPATDAATDAGSLDRDDDPPGDADLELEASEPKSVLGRLREPLEGSIYDRDIGELWDPEHGAENRLLLVAQESAGMSDGLPRLVHGAIGFGELYAKHADGDLLDGDDEQEPDEQDDGDRGRDDAGGGMGGDTQEVLQFDG